MEIYVNMFIPYFFFLVVNHGYVIYIDFYPCTASNTATDDVANQVTHKVFNTN